MQRNCGSYPDLCRRPSGHFVLTRPPFYFLLTGVKTFAEVGVVDEVRIHKRKWNVVPEMEDETDEIKLKLARIFAAEI